jgi:hypothetical protein
MMSVPTPKLVEAANEPVVFDPTTTRANASATKRGPACARLK